MFESPAIRKKIDAELSKIRDAGPGNSTASSDVRKFIPGCKERSGGDYLEFYVFDSTIRSAFCLTSFAWPAPKKEPPDPLHPVSIIALNGTKISGHLILDLWGGASADAALKPGPDYDRVAKKHKLEAIGLTAAALIYDFSDNAQPYFTYLDGLKFDRIHKAAPACTNESGAKLATHVELPSVDDVLRWLEKNASTSSQPFAAFVAAFEQAGASATPLRVQRKTIDLCEQTARWFSMVRSRCPGYTFAHDSDVDPKSASTDGQRTGTGSLVGDFFSNTGELAMLAFEWLLFLIADHGFRPGKVIWSVVITLLAFSCLFWFVLGIVGFEAKSKDDRQQGPKPPSLWPVSFLFLFDRLIPAYKIRNEHYEIARVYRKATAAEIEAVRRNPGEPPYPIRYLGFNFLVWPAGDAKLRQLETWVIVLRVVGVALTVFLLAAINTLVR